MGRIGKTEKRSMVKIKVIINIRTDTKKFIAINTTNSAEKQRLNK